VPYSYTRACRAHPTTVRRSEPSSAGRNPEMVNPVTSIDNNQKRIAFNINVESPKVRSVIGSVRRRSIGRTSNVIRPHNTATMSATVKLVIAIPGTI